MNEVLALIAVHILRLVLTGAAGAVISRWNRDFTSVLEAQEAGTQIPPEVRARISAEINELDDDLQKIKVRP